MRWTLSSPAALADGPRCVRTVSVRADGHADGRPPRGGRARTAAGQGGEVAARSLLPSPRRDAEEVRGKGLCDK